MSLLALTQKAFRGGITGLTVIAVLGILYFSSQSLNGWDDDPDTLSGSSGENSASIQQDPDWCRVIIKLKDQPLSPLAKQLKAKGHNQLIRKQKMREHGDKLNQAHSRLKNFIHNIEPTHQARFKEFRTAFNGVATEVKTESIAALKTHPDVVSVHYDLEVRVSLNDSVPLIDADTIWNTYSASGTGIVVAVIDTGIDYNHAALGSGFGPGHKVIGGYDFVNDDDDPMDDHGHGTHVAGIIAANGPITGVAPDTKLLAYKVMSSSGKGYMSDVIDGISRALDPNDDLDMDDAADIINISLGGSGNPDDDVSQAVDNAVNSGAICVVAAGNDGSGYWTIASPGCARKAITVGASDKSDVIASFSSRGPVDITYAIKPDITAPGVAIYSAYLDNHYAIASGTSMAAPHVAGICALLRQLHPTWTPDEIKSVLIQTAKDIGEDNFTQGSGRVRPVEAHLAQAVILPGLSAVAQAGSVSFGLDDLSLDTWGKTEYLEIKSLTSTALSYSLTVSAGYPAGISYSVEPQEITLTGEGVTGTITFTVTVDNMIVPHPSNDACAYEGRLLVTSTTEALIVPFAFLKRNNSPGVPSAPSGTASAITGIDYTYTTSATDTDTGDQIKYTFDWGDGTTTTTDYYDSGVETAVTHTWDAANTYSVQVKATDQYDAGSGWSDSLVVTVSGPAVYIPPKSSSSGSRRRCGCMGLEPFVLWIIVRRLKRRKSG
jgi:subtilisin family serine protease